MAAGGGRVRPLPPAIRAEVARLAAQGGDVQNINLNDLRQLINQEVARAPQGQQPRLRASIQRSMQALGLQL